MRLLIQFISCLYLHYMSLLQSGTEEVKLNKGEKLKLTLDDKYKDNCDEKTLWLDYKNITKVVQQGSKIYIDDGLISLKVLEIGQSASSSV